MAIKYTEKQYKALSERFNKMPFIQKLITIKNNSEIFLLEISDGNLFLRLHDNDAMFKEYDLFFEFPQFLSDKDYSDLFLFIDIKIKVVK
jgi:hypothetical protein